MNNFQRARRTLAASTIAALGLAGLLVGGSPATAAERTVPSTSEKSPLAFTEATSSSGDSARAAAAQPYFRIFYGQNCYSGGTGSRAYFGTNAGEAWINDRYNEGGAGNGQYIRKNAASVYVANGRFLLSTDGGYSYRTFPSQSGGTCFNLDSATFRNQNTNWIMKR
ncbi:hypothetical protein A4X17_04525 [Plantibacter sp. H53]|uniref:hypothetical protein n=1 Tax=Plantibacter sp. H53 TaxID=1827323 RepID=UPI0007D8FF7A|nr:hypothetical protein [Plantibacter sp. H53]OAN30828.1 hypothetical protein A4X17_04525 [Plantibacter sp. H53]